MPGLLEQRSQIPSCQEQFGASNRISDTEERPVRKAQGTVRGRRARGEKEGLGVSRLGSYLGKERRADIEAGRRRVKVRRVCGTEGTGTGREDRKVKRDGGD